MRKSLSIATLAAFAMIANTAVAPSVLAQAQGGSASPNINTPIAPGSTTPSTEKPPVVGTTPPAATGGTMAPGAGETGTTHKRVKKHARQTLQQRFDQANTTHDGHLTREQASAARWTYVDKNFESMDKDHKGYVTVEDIHSYAHVKHASRKSVPAAAPSAAPPAPAPTTPAAPTPTGTAPTTP